VSSLAASKPFNCGLDLPLCEVALIRRKHLMPPPPPPPSYFHHHAHSALPSFFETLVHTSTLPTPRVVPHIHCQLFQHSSALKPLISSVMDFFLSLTLCSYSCMSGGHLGQHAMFPLRPIKCSFTLCSFNHSSYFQTIVTLQPRE
jgi:hypothetical protein